MLHCLYKHKYLNVINADEFQEYFNLSLAESMEREPQNSEVLGFFVKMVVFTKICYLHFSDFFERCVN